MSIMQSEEDKNTSRTESVHPFSYIRISKIELNNFKSVKHGEILLNRAGEIYPEEFQSDILGIYGQNGSGKTSVIEALSILSTAMSGKNIPTKYVDCVSVGQNNPFSTLKFTFDMQLPEGEKRIVEYKFSLKKIELTKDEIKEKWEKAHEGREIPDDFSYNDERNKYKISLFDETVKMSRVINGKKTRLETIC